MRRVFLDANVLFSAAYRDAPGLLALWRLSDVELLTSGYAAEEARRNLDTPVRTARLERLLGDARIVPEPRPVPLPAGVRLPEKDQPILGAAIAAESTHLLTGDLRDFGPLMGRRIAGVLVQTPGEFLKRGR